MKINIKLFGTLGSHCPGYEHSAGLQITVNESITVQRLVDHLALPAGHVGIVTINGKLVKADCKIPDGADVKVFQPLAGG